MKWWSSSKRLMKIIKGVNSAKFSTHQLLRNNQRQVSKTTSVLHIKYLEREDHNAEVKCIAVNTNLTKPSEKSFRINLVRKYDYLVQIFQWKLILSCYLWTATKDVSYFFSCANTCPHWSRMGIFCCWEIIQHYLQCHGIRTNAIHQNTSKP